MDPKMEAKKAALMGMSSKYRDESRKPMGDELGKKKMTKVVVSAPDEKSLAKGLSKAQELIKAKFGDMGLDEEVMEALEGEGCPICGDSMEDMHEHEETEMPEEMEEEVLEVE